jgi:hypothetical protein
MYDYIGGYTSNPGIDRTKIFYKGEFEIEDYDKLEKLQKN